MRAPATLVLAALVASGCAFGVSSSASSLSCENVPAGACEEQGRILTTGLAGVTDVIIQCREAPPCTRAAGAGMAEIRFKNGQKLNRAWSYTGDPGVPPITCLGVAQQLCQSYVQPEIDSVPPSRRVTAVTATCSSTTCTDAAGELKVRITLEDGSELESVTGWSGS